MEMRLLFESMLSKAPPGLARGGTGSAFSSFFAERSGGDGRTGQPFSGELGTALAKLRVSPPESATGGDGASSAGAEGGQDVQEAGADAHQHRPTPRTGSWDGPVPASGAAKKALVLEGLPEELEGRAPSAADGKQEALDSWMQRLREALPGLPPDTAVPAVKTPAPKADAPPPITFGTLGARKTATPGKPPLVTSWRSPGPGEADSGSPQRAETTKPGAVAPGEAARSTESARGGAKPARPPVPVPSPATTTTPEAAVQAARVEAVPAAKPAVGGTTPDPFANGETPSPKQAPEAPPAPKQASEAPPAPKQASGAPPAPKPGIAAAATLKTASIESPSPSATTSPAAQVPLPPAATPVGAPQSTRPGKKAQTGLSEGAQMQARGKGEAPLPTPATLSKNDPGTTTGTSTPSAGARAESDLTAVGRQDAQQPFSEVRAGSGPAPSASPALEEPALAREPGAAPNAAGSAAGSASGAASAPAAGSGMTNATGASAAAPSGGQGGQAPAAPAVDQVVARLSQLSQGQSALISLEPPELGRVLVRFVKRGKGWRVHLVADSREVAQALTRDLGRLSQVLGREADPIEVDVSTDAGQDGHRSAGSHDHDGEEAAFEQKLPPSPPAAARKSLARDARGRTAQQLTLSSLDVRG